MAACPDGRCDGSGFLFDEAAPARAAVLAAGRRGSPRKRGRRARGPDPAALPRGVASSASRCSRIERANPHVVREVRQYVRDVAEQLDAGRGHVVHRRRRDRQDDARDADLQGGDGGRPHRRDLLAAAAARRCCATPTTTTPRYSLNELIDRLCAVDLLHVDDVGAEQTSPWVLEQLYTIVNTRYEDGRAMLLTTNLITREGDDALREQIGDRTVSRLYEICGEPMPMYGEDQRGVDATA